MAARRPLVRVGGQNVQLPAGDTLAGVGDFMKDGSVQMTGPVNEAPMPQIGSAATTNIGSTSSNVLDLIYDSTQTITSFGVAVRGIRRTLTRTGRSASGQLNQDSAPITLIHNADSLVLPGSANITMIIGDSIELESLGGGKWHALNYQRGSGQALNFGPGGTLTKALNEPAQATVTAASLVDLGLIDTNFIQIIGASGAVLISSFGTVPNGAERTIIFGNVFNGVTIQNSPNIDLPGGANIVVSLYDRMIMRSLDNNTWKVISYIKANGTAVVSSGSGPANTDALPEGATNLYFTNARAQAANTDRVLLSSVGAANGVAPLGSDSKIASAYLPSYVDDVLEYTNLAAFPATGETGKIYIALDTNREYRWSGSTYIQLVASPGTTDNVPEGTTNLYFTAARVLSVALAGLSLVAGTAVVATDSILVAAGKLQKQITDLTAVVAGKEPSITAGTAAQYWNGSKVFVDFAGSVRSAVLTAISFATSTPVTAADSVLTAIGKLQAQLTAYGGVFRTETIATTSVGQTSYAVPNGYTAGSIIVFFNGVLQAPTDYTATDGANVVLASGSLTTSDIMSVLVIGAVRAQDDALLQYTVASLPTASTNAFKQRWCTNMSGGAGVVVSNGTNWVRVADNTVVTV